MRVLLLLVLLTVALGEPLFCAITGRDISIYSLSATAEYQGFANEDHRFNVTILATSPANQSNVTAAYNSCGDAGAAIVAQVLTPIGSNWLQAAEDYPNTTWANVQQTPNFTVLSPPNTQWAPRTSWYAAFVKGFVAGIMSNSGEIGMVIPFQLAPFTTDTNAFYLGMKLANISSNLTTYVVGTYFSTEIVAAVEALFAAQPSMDVVSQQMGTLDVQHAVFNLTTDVYVVEDILSLRMSPSNVASVIGNPKVLTATTQNLVPLFEYWADLYLENAFVPRGLILTNKIDHEIIYNNSPFSPLIPRHKLHEIRKVHKKYVNKGKNPFCGDLAVEYLGNEYQLVNNCLTDYDILTGVNFAQDIALLFP